MSARPQENVKWVDVSPPNPLTSPFAPAKQRSHDAIESLLIRKSIGPPRHCISPRGFHPSCTWFRRRPLQARLERSSIRRSSGACANPPVPSPPHTCTGANRCLDIFPRYRLCLRTEAHQAIQSWDGGRLILWNCKECIPQATEAHTSYNDCHCHIMAPLSVWSIRSCQSCRRMVDTLLISKNDAKFRLCITGFIS